MSDNEQQTWTCRTPKCERLAFMGFCPECREKYQKNLYELLEKFEQEDLQKRGKK